MTARTEPGPQILINDFTNDQKTKRGKYYYLEYQIRETSILSHYLGSEDGFLFIYALLLLSQLLYPAVNPLSPDP